MIEIVSAPDLRSAEEAHAYLTALRDLLLYAGVSDCHMEEGSLRCDANVSVRPRGQRQLGTRAEIKNLNSFHHVARALEHEIARQVAVLESGGSVVQETRLWNAERGETAPMRSKEEAHDYRYFPEPDLPPLVVDGRWVEQLRRALPELPAARRERFVAQYGVPPYDASVLTQERALADYFEAAAAASGDAKSASNWVMTEVLRRLKDDERPIERCPVAPLALAGLLKLIGAGTISGRIAKDVFEKMWATGEDAARIVEREGLRQVSDEGELATLIAELVAAARSRPPATARETAALGWFVGQVMKRTGRPRQPAARQPILRQALEADPRSADRRTRLADGEKDPNR